MKKKQGSFKIGRGRGGKVVTQKRNRKEGRAAVKNNRPVRTGIKVYKNRQSGFGGGRGSRSRYFNNVIAGAGNIIVGVRKTLTNFSRMQYRNYNFKV